MSEAEKRVLDARSKLLVHAHGVFFGTLALRLKVEMTSETETADIDGITIRFNPAFVDTLANEQLLGLWAHEIMHPAAGQLFRMDGLEHDLANKAGDYAINPLLIASKFQLPAGALVDPRFDGQAMETIYRTLKAEEQSQRSSQPNPSGAAPGGQNAQPGGQGAASGAGTAAGPGAGDPAVPGAAQSGPVTDPGKCGAMRQPVAGSAADGKAAELEWTIATIQAANLAKQAGQMTAELARVVDTIKRPRVDWRERLRNLVSSQTPGDYRMSPPNRRYVAQGLYLPSLRPDRIGEMVLMIDTSGSVSDEELTAFAAELNGIIDEARPDKLHVLYINTAVRGHDEYTADDYPIRLTCKGGGGTDLRPGFEYLAAHGIDPTAVIYLTDLDCPAARMPKDPGYPVIWASTGADKAPFGELVRLRAG